MSICKCAANKSGRFLSASVIVFAVMVLAATGGECLYDFSMYRNAAVSNFQVPLLLSEGKCGFTYEGFADAVGGTDLRIADAQGGLLPYEIESWNPGGVSVVWVKVPVLSKDTKLKLTWGETATENASATEKDFWDDSLAVFHFGKTGGLNSANGEVFEEVSGSVPSVASPAGTGAVFDRSAYYVQRNAKAETYFPENLSAFSLSFWIKTDKLTTPDDQTYLFQMGHPITDTMDTQIALLFNWDADANVRFYWHTSIEGKWDVGAKEMSIPTDGEWHHLAYTYDGNTFTAYCDGSAVRVWTFSGFAIKAWEKDGHFSLGGTAGGKHKFDGMLDEFRFERVCRDADWIKAEVETQAPKFRAVIPFADYDGGALSDFPAYVHLDGNLGLDMSKLVEDLHDGDALVSDLATGALLPFELEYANVNAFDQSIGLWVRMPEYSSDAGVVIEQTPKNFSLAPSIITNEIGSAYVWNGDNDVLVFHMNPTGKLYNAVNGSALGMNYANIKSGVRGYPVPADGPTGPCQAYRSTTNSVQTVNEHVVSLKSPLKEKWTVSWWAKEDEEEYSNPKPETYVWAIQNLAALKGVGYKGHGAGENTTTLYPNGKECKLDIPDTGWHHYAYAADGKEVCCYRDGELKKTANATWGSVFGFESEFKGYVRLMSSGNPVKDAFRGCADEFRLESACRDADWIKASYLNQLAWRDGVPWQFAPHFADVSNDVPEEGYFTAVAELSCRTSAAVTLFWGTEDAGEKAAGWEHSSDLGEFRDKEVASGIGGILSPGIRYAYRFRAVNDHGTAWSPVYYVTAPVASRRGKRAKIDVSYSGGETLKDFPLCVRIPSSNGLPDDRTQVQFYDQTGRELAWEAEMWNPAGESVVGVCVPELTSQSSLTMRFGGIVPDNGAWPADSVWRPDEHCGVWHFAGSDATGVFTADSTSYGGKITSQYSDPKTEVFAHVTNGVAGEAFHFPRTMNEGGFSGNSVEINDFRSGFTFSAWLRILDPTGNVNQIYVKHELVGSSVLPEGGFLQYQIRYKPGSEIVDFYIYAKDDSIYPTIQNSDKLALEITKALAVSRLDDQWHHYAFVSDGMYLHAYLDGECKKSTFFPLVLNAGVIQDKKMKVAFGNNTRYYYCARGSIDEHRVERVGRSAAWIKACCDNQRPGSAFVKVGGTHTTGTVVVLR